MLIKNENKELLNNKKISETLKIINEEDMTFFINHDWNMYLNTHRDLEQYKINNVEKAYLHYMNHGKKENREIFSLDIPSSNETIVVLNTTKENNIKEVCNIQEEYNFQEEHNIHLESKINQESSLEKQIPMIMENKSETLYHQNDDKDFFDQHDWNRYLIDNNDLFKEGIQTELDAYYHYLTYGQFEKRIVHKKNRFEY